MDRKDFVLAVMSSCPGAVYNPVQVQKLFFLIDAKIPNLVNGPHFAFSPYDYGPFDRSVYFALEALEDEDLVTIDRSAVYRTYTATRRGQAKGQVLFDALPNDAKKYVRQLSEFVRSVSFNELVSAVYHAYPEMRTNSVFRD